MADFTLVPLLRKCSDDDLEPLVKFIKKAELTGTLSNLRRTRPKLQTTNMRKESWRNERAEG